eukprot:SAG22_NODE_4_length_44774_cov_362.122149_29_plen_136_part_00
MLIEPVLGEGGYVVPSLNYMKALRAFCDKHGLLLIADEVQSGAGRTGKWWAMDHNEGVLPDIMICAKGIASGYPLSAVVARSELTGAKMAACPCGRAPAAPHSYPAPPALPCAIRPLPPFGLAWPQHCSETATPS